MNVIEAAKAAGMKASIGKTDKDGKYHPDVNALASSVPIEWLERFAQIIRNQALEDAAKCCIDEQVEVESCGNKEDEAYNAATEHCACAIRSMKKDKTNG